MKKSKQTIDRGIYLVIDPAMDETTLLDKLDIVLNERIVAVQIWDNFPEEQRIQPLIKKISDRCHKKAVPLLINNRWEYLTETVLDGVHFDAIPHDFDHIKTKVNRSFLSGLTCNNNLATVQWAATHHIDYISFCSMFPSTTSNSCELVNFETVREAQRIFPNPIFLAGGIKPDNVRKLDELEYHGIAVISGIMTAESPIESIHQYNQYLNAKS